MGNSKATKPGSAMIGVAGEHYVLFRLLSQGVLAGLAPQGTKDVDILAMSADEEIACRVQVKTRLNKTGWPMNLKHESLIDADLVYAFVDLSGEVPVTYLIPSAVVADVLTKSHQAWMATPGKKGKKKDSPMRVLKASYVPATDDYPAGWIDRWHERWDLIAGPGSTAG